MKLKTAVFIIFISLTLMASGLYAHEYYRIVGTIIKFQNSKLEVKTKEGKVYIIGLDQVSVVRVDKTEASVAELKSGRSVVVDATGDSEKALLADLVRIVPALPR